MLIEVVLLILAGNVISANLTGDHICREEQKRVINVTEYLLRNATIRHYEWCMNVPPRCSFYTTKLINESRLVEKDIIETVTTCCSGYSEDKNSKTCTPVCPDCLNGTCVDGKCSCFPGYKGDHCDITCSESEWGENCIFQCACNGGGCDAYSGKCACPAGWVGERCHVQCSNGFYGIDCKEDCKCEDQSVCSPVTGQCYSSSTSPPDDLSSNQPTKTQTPTGVKFSNNGKFEVDPNGIVSTTNYKSTEETFYENSDKSKTEQILPNNHLSSTSSEDGFNTSTGPFQIGKIHDKTTDLNQEINYLNDNGRPEVNKNQNDLVNSASAATAISVGIIVLAGMIVVYKHLKKRKKNDNTKKSKALSTVAVYTHSIFHTPLPDPPTLESPTFIGPVEMNSGNEGRFEARVVCSMNIPAQPNAKDTKDCVYDHPPSTGSYRPESIPEPPDIDVQFCTTAAQHSEPLYDEIPLGTVPTPISQPPPYKPSSLYMNTCGKTRF